MKLFIWMIESQQSHYEILWLLPWLVWSKLFRIHKYFSHHFKGRMSPFKFVPEVTFLKYILSGIEFSGSGSSLN